MGQVTVRGNDLYWNGMLIPRDTYAALAVACGYAFTAAGIPLPVRKPAMEYPAERPFSRHHGFDKVGSRFFQASLQNIL